MTTFEWSESWDFANRLQARADTLVGEERRLWALERSLKHVPHRPSTAFAHYYLLTICGIYDNRKLRWQLAKRLFLQDDRPERLATFLVTKLKTYKNKIAQIVTALKDPRAVENAIRAAKKVIVDVGATVSSMARDVGAMLSGLCTGIHKKAAEPDNQLARWKVIQQLRSSATPRCDARITA